METLPTPARIRRDDNKYIGDVPRTENFGDVLNLRPIFPTSDVVRRRYEGTETSESILTQLDTRTTA